MGKHHLVLGVTNLQTQATLPKESRLCNLA